jgi:carboxypeptidase C (cathepsin A)
MSEPETPKPDAEADKRARERVDKLLARAAVLGSGQVRLASGRQIDYGVRAAFVPVTAGGFGADAGEPQAAVFTVAYTAPGATSAPRPVCFAFNGGPGSSSIWLHLGALGPKRVAVNDDGTMPPPPYRVVDNPHSWIEHFDLVFVDPPHTGFSLSASAKARESQLSIDGDIETMSEVVRAWLAANRRFGSPLYLAGESYGTTRGAAIADRLQGLGLALSGVILVSCAMDLQSFMFAPRNDLPYALFLPGFANVAQYHGLLRGPVGASPEAARAAAEAFVADDYLAALHLGSRLDGSRRRRIEKRLVELTGLADAVVRDANLRISDQCFFFEALRAQGRQVGRLEARVTGPMGAARSREWEFDPGSEALNGPYTTAALAYFAELGLALEQRYEVLSFDVHRAWKWQRKGRPGEGEDVGYASTSADLARALRRNPHLRVLVASGRYDLGTPYSATDWSLAQLDVPADVMARVAHHHYDAGHMMYTRSADMARLKTEVAAFVAG